MKGENILYNDLVPNSLEEPGTGVKSHRNLYLDRRSDKMAARYYYHSVICRLRYDDCLLHLSSEFDLEPDTIIGYIKKRLSFVNSMIKHKMTSAELRRKYPFYDWSGRGYSTAS